MNPAVADHEIIVTSSCGSRVYLTSKRPKFRCQRHVEALTRLHCLSWGLGRGPGSSNNSPCAKWIFGTDLRPARGVPRVRLQRQDTRRHSAAFIPSCAAARQDMLVAWVWWKTACRSFDRTFVESELSPPNVLDGPNCPGRLERPRSPTAKRVAEVQPNMQWRSYM